MRVIQERNGSNVPAVSYTLGTDLSGSLEGAGGIGGLLGRTHGYSSGNWSTHSFYHADGNGNITRLINSSQSSVASYRYDPYGNSLSQSGTLAFDNRYRFSSKRLHHDTGLYYYGYRFYDPNLQRWLNRDPLGDEAAFRDAIRHADLGYAAVLYDQSLRNLYTSLYNSPSTHIDSDGRIAIFFPAAAGVAVVAGSLICWAYAPCRDAVFRPPSEALARALEACRASALVKITCKSVAFIDMECHYDCGDFTIIRPPGIDGCKDIEVEVPDN